MSHFSPKRVAIVGCGITGLTAAFWLRREARVDVALIDPEPGGKLRSDFTGGMVIDKGPDSIFLGKQGATETLEALELISDTIQPKTRGFSIFTGGKLCAVPPGLASLGSIAPEAVGKADFLTDEGKRSVLHPSAAPSEGDPSIASFFRSKYGEEFSRIVAEPLLAGTHAGNPWKLSLRALYPSYLQEGASAGQAGFVSFREGIGRLVRVLEDRLGDVERFTARAITMEKSHEGILITTDRRQERIDADFALLAVPCNLAANIVRGVAPDAATTMAEVRHASSMVATFAVKTSELMELPEGTGFLVASGEDCPITGATWTSNKWAGRAPDEVFLMRVFMGRDGDPPISTLTLAEMRTRALTGLQMTAGIEATPFFESIGVWNDALPQYEIGHIERVAHIRGALSDVPIEVAGTSYDGVGIADCMRQGREAAARIVERMDS